MELVNRRAIGNKSFHDESSLHLKKSTEGEVMIEAGSLFQSLATRTEKDEFLQRRRLGTLRDFKRVTSQPWTHWWQNEAS